MAGVNINLLPATGKVLIDAQALADETGIGVMPSSVCGRYVEATFFVEFSAGASAGQVLIESAPSRNYSGTWVIEGTVNWAAESKAHRVSLNLLTGAMRARISTEIADGTVTVTAFASTNS
jgi:hypothetical protein